MVELELLGLHGDGEHLTLTDEDGRRYRLVIDDSLRAAVRRDRPGLEALRAAGESTLRPKDIQTLIRAGASVAEVAEQSGLPAEHVRRYEGPVVAERSWVVQRAQAQRVGHESDAPRLGDLVVDRLAARGVDSASLEWDAVRRQGAPWEVLVTFVAGEREREARWQVDLAAKTMHAVDDESRWLSETDVGPGAHPRRHLNPVGARSRVFDVEAEEGPRRTTNPTAASTTSAPSAGSAPTAGDGTPTETLLAELAAHRGTRGELQPELEPEDEDGDALWGAHPPASRPEEATDAHVLALPRREPASVAATDEPGTTPALPAEEAPAAIDRPRATERRPAREAAPSEDSTAEKPAKRRQRRSTRRSVPSWDEIVFGARPE